MRFWRQLLNHSYKISVPVKGALDAAPLRALFLARPDFCLGNTGPSCFLSISTKSLPSKRSHARTKADLQREAVLSQLSSLLQVDEKEVRTLIQRFPDLARSRISLSATLEFLLEKKGISVERILKHGWILLIPPETLEERLKVVISFLPIKAESVAIPFTSFPVETIKELGVLWKRDARLEKALIEGGFSSRLQYLAEKLHVPQETVADFLVRIKRLSFTSFSKIQRVVELLLDEGVSPTDIAGDPWIFMHNLEVMKERLKNAKSRKLPEIKPWILRCSVLKYESYVRRTLEEQRVIASHESIENFLQHRLNWSSACLNDVLNQVPSIRNSKPSRLDRMIEFLLSKGFTSCDIAAYPRILRQSVATVAQRTSELSEIVDGSLPSHMLNVICRGQKKYERYVMSLRMRQIQAPSSQQTSMGPPG